MPHELPITVYYEDTDAAGVVYHANYLNFMERARSEMLLQAGFDLFEHHRRGCFFVVTNVTLRYRRPALLGEHITVKSSVKEMRRASVVIEQRIYRQETLLVEGEVTVAWLGQSGRPERLPEVLQNLHRNETARPEDSSPA